MQNRYMFWCGIFILVVVLIISVYEIWAFTAEVDATISVFYWWIRDNYPFIEYFLGVSNTLIVVHFVPAIKGHKVVTWENRLSWFKWKQKQLEKKN